MVANLPGTSLAYWDEMSAMKLTFVMLVDDHPTLRVGLKTILLGASDIALVGEAGDGLSAVQMAIELQPDVVVMDISLPQLGGIEATKRILAKAPAVKVLALTAYEDRAIARMLLDIGAAGFLLKRSACDDLTRAVQVVAAGGTYVDPAMSSELLHGRSQRIGLPSGDLSPREFEVIRLIVEGQTGKEAAAALGLSPRTLETYKVRAMNKLNLRSRAELIRYSVRCGWLQAQYP
jgi:DNA-binding NarL/FixJ family response regulator